MAKKNNAPSKFTSLTEGLKAFGGPPPLHPLITVLNGIDSNLGFTPPTESHVLSYYKISFRPNLGGSLRYGQTHFDFNEGGLFFAAPNQIVAQHENEPGESGCSGREAAILIHPDFLLNSPLALKIKKYEFFSYSVNEALHLSEKEKEIILSLFRNIEDELTNRIDELSQDVVLAQIELLLNYAQRFYKRQFITRKTINNTLLEKFEQLLNDHFDNEKKSYQGIPTVQNLADSLAISSGYLSDMLRTLTGQNAQQHIHEKLIEKAKEKLSNTNLSVSEIAYELGFEHLQSFSKLFRNKTNETPLKFRARFN
ncbi:helix-turn-helix transcriptional regulator [Flavobacterium sp.]|uniref:helix-turn-helix domain-containing protein n=1 Tax=Flavobacterium sp. TaxID=239 RepID=UPI0031D5189A